MDFSQGSVYYYKNILYAYEYFVTVNFDLILNIMGSPFDIVTPHRCVLNYLGFRSFYY
jgi:hypothetical protein